MKAPRMLRVEHLTKSFGGVRAVDDCSFTVHAQQITALIGPNGAGKTTVFHCVSGALEADRGRVWLGQRELTHRASWQRARAGMSRTFQQARLFPYLTVEENLLLVTTIGDDRLRAVFARDADHQRARVRAALARVGLPAELLHRSGSDCSYGQSKLLEIARALLWLETVREQSACTMHHAVRDTVPHGILLLDEPVAGVHPALRKQIADILRQLRSDGETMVCIEHDMDFVRALADRIIVMAEGTVLLAGTPQEVLSHPEVLEAYVGIEATRPQLRVARGKRTRV